MFLVRGGWRILQGVMVPVEGVVTEEGKALCLKMNVLHAHL